MIESKEISVIKEVNNSEIVMNSSQENYQNKSIEENISSNFQDSQPIESLTNEIPSEFPENFKFGIHGNKLSPLKIRNNPSEYFCNSDKKGNSPVQKVSMQNPLKSECKYFEEVNNPLNDIGMQKSKINKLQKKNLDEEDEISDFLNDTEEIFQKDHSADDKSIKEINILKIDNNLMSSISIIVAKDKKMIEDSFFDQASILKNFGKQKKLEVECSNILNIENIHTLDMNEVYQKPDDNTKNEPEKIINSNTKFTNNVKNNQNFQINSQFSLDNPSKKKQNYFQETKQTKDTSLNINMNLNMNESNPIPTLNSIYPNPFWISPQIIPSYNHKFERTLNNFNYNRPLPGYPIQLVPMYNENPYPSLQKDPHSIKNQNNDYSKRHYKSFYANLKNNNEYQNKLTNENNKDIQLNENLNLKNDKLREIQMDSRINNNFINLNHKEVVDSQRNQSQSTYINKFSRKEFHSELAFINNHPILPQSNISKNKGNQNILKLNCDLNELIKSTPQREENFEMIRNKAQLKGNSTEAPLKDLSNKEFSGNKYCSIQKQGINDIYNGGSMNNKINEVITIDMCNSNNEKIKGKLMRRREELSVKLNKKNNSEGMQKKLNSERTKNDILRLRKEMMKPKHKLQRHIPNNSNSEDMKNDPISETNNVKEACNVDIIEEKNKLLIQSKVKIPEELITRLRFGILAPVF